MTVYEVKVGLQFAGTEGEDLDGFTDIFMDQLVSLNDEADLGGSVTSGLFEATVTVEADSPFDALCQGCIIIKTAAHASGGSTGELEVPTEWPSWLHEVSLAADPVLDDSAESNGEPSEPALV